MPKKATTAIIFFPVYLLLSLSPGVIAQERGASNDETTASPSESPLSNERNTDQSLQADTDRPIQNDSYTTPERAEFGTVRAVSIPFKPYRLNYFLPYTYSSQKIVNDTIKDTRHKGETKFQISILVDVLSVVNYKVKIFYGQRAFWQVFDVKYSRPFREVNYNPGMMLETPRYFNVLNGVVHFNVILDHVSNGQVEPYSRSQNRASLSAVYTSEFIYFEWRGLNRFSEERKKFPEDPEGDENPDLYKYQGNNEIHFIYNNGIYAGMWLRGNPQYSHYTMELDIGVPIPGTAVKFHLQYFNGYMESMIDYNRHITKLGIGFMFGV